jgi:predicted unusual protein kinase regulating ubiquinone biosynthesis (AarF/ABC1/UbiB family)
MAKKKLKSPPKSSFLRSISLLGASGRVLSNQLGTFVKSSFSENALLQQIKNKARVEQIRILTETLSHLKGSAMKFGQMLSLDAQDLLPPEALEILAKLQNKATPVDSDELFRQIKKDLGEAKFLELNLETVPLATASIGQVFKGSLNSDHIVTKVQYPGISETVDSDIAVLKVVLAAVGLVIGKQMDLNELFEELRYVLKNEVDYKKEAESLQKYKLMLKGDDRFLVPDVNLDYSSEHVLTMSYVKGHHLKDWISSQPSLDAKEQVGRSILDLYCKEYFEHGFVQTDPNLANFLVDEDTLCLSLLDFGATLSYEPKFREDYKNLLKTIFSSGEKEVIDFCVQHNILFANESAEAKKLFFDMLKLAVYPFRPENQPFHFSSRDYSAQIRAAIFSFVREAKFTPPPRELIFLHRKLGGIFNILKMMDLRLDLTRYRELMMGEVTVSEKITKKLNKELSDIK